MHEAGHMKAAYSLDCCKDSQKPLCVVAQHGVRWKTLLKLLGVSLHVGHAFLAKQKSTQVHNAVLALPCENINNSNVIVLYSATRRRDTFCTVVSTR